MLFFSLSIRRARPADFFAKALRKDESAYQSFNPRPFPLGDTCFQPASGAARIARPGEKGLRKGFAAPACQRSFSLKEENARPPGNFAGKNQHCGTLRARPPNAVSLYFAFMSRPVSAMAVIASSRLTRCIPGGSDEAIKYAV